MSGATRQPPTVALLHWGDCIEDFLEPLDVSVEGFLHDVDGGWMFGYIDALARAGVHTVLVLVSRSVTRPERRVHRATGAPVWLLPPTRVHGVLRQTLPQRYAWTLREAVADRRGPGRVAAALARQVVGYSATPLRALAEVLRREGCRALVVQEYEHPRFDVAVPLARRLGVRVLATFQGGDRPQTLLERPLRRLAVRRADGLLIGSAAEAARVRRRYRLPAGRIVAVPNPLDVAWWQAGDRTAARRAHGWSQQQLVVAWHGRVDLRRKGLDVLVDAWATLQAEGPEGPEGLDARLLLVGTGADRELLAARLRTLEQRPGGGQVTWIDDYLTDRAAVRDLLAGADVYAFPSRHEGFPVAPLEAMASGLPVVAAAAPGVAEIFPEGEASGGLVVPAGDAVAFTAALRRLLTDAALRRRVAAAAQRRAQEGFSPQAVGALLRRAVLED